jgi:hypothetical protein
MRGFVRQNFGAIVVRRSHSKIWFERTLVAYIYQNKATHLAPLLIPSERRLFGLIFFQSIRADPLFKQRPHRRYGMEAHHVGVDRHRSTCADRSRR